MRSNRLIALSLAASTLLAGVPLRAGGPVPPIGGYSHSTPRHDDHRGHDHHRDDYGRPDYDRGDYGRPDYGRDDYGRPDYGRGDYGRPDYGRGDYGRGDPGYAPIRMVKLGSVVANSRECQNDLFEVRSRQRYSGIVFKVDRGDIAVDRIRVTFGDDSSFLPDTKVVFTEGQGTCRIDFPGYIREIKRVRIRYQSLTRGVSIIDVYGIPCD